MPTTGPVASPHGRRQCSAPHVIGSFMRGLASLRCHNFDRFEISSWLLSARHTGITMTRDQTSKLELACLCEVPDNLVRLLRRNTSRIWIVVLHLWVPLHHFRVLLVFLGRCKHEFVVELSVIVEHEFDLWPCNGNSGP